MENMKSTPHNTHIPWGKVHVCYLDFFFLSADTSHNYEHAISARWNLNNPNCVHSHLFYDFKTHMHELLIFKLKILMLVKWSYRSPNQVVYWAETG